jgi:hypothetical protein
MFLKQSNLTSSAYILMVQKCLKRVASGFRRDTDEICALLGYYTPQSGNSVPTLRDNLSYPCSRVKNSSSLTVKMEPIGWPETYV